MIQKVAQTLPSKFLLSKDFILVIKSTNKDFQNYFQFIDEGERH